MNKLVKILLLTPLVFVSTMGTTLASVSEINHSRSLPITYSTEKRLDVNVPDLAWFPRVEVVATATPAPEKPKPKLKTVTKTVEEEVVTITYPDPGEVGEPDGARGYAKKLLTDMGWDGQQWACLDNLWEKESNWNYLAKNPSSGAYGIPQSLPGSKMAAIDDDWMTNPKTQILWGLDYINGRYGSPCNAWAHSVATNWY